jgi:DNA-binding transcriptional LysR family regulator
MGMDGGMNWDDIRVFLVLAEERSFRKAAKRMNQAPRAVRARIDAFEQQVGRLLFTRAKLGVELTPAGIEIRQAASTMHHGARRLLASFTKSTKTIRTVNIGCTEGLGAFWIMPRLLELTETEPGLNITLNCETSVQDVASLAVDFAIQFDPPNNPDLIVTRLCWLHVVLFASQRYVTRHGAPQTKAELGNFNVLEIAGAQIWREALELDSYARDRKEFVRFTTNTASAQLVGTSRGGGISALPTYTETLTQGLVHVAQDWVLRRDLWLVCNPNVVNHPHIRKCIEYVKRAFDPARFPWFREEFIPPAEIRRFIKERGLMTMFEGYSEYSDIPPELAYEAETLKG